MNYEYPTERVEELEDQQRSFVLKFNPVDGWHFTWIGEPRRRDLPKCGARCRDGHSCRARVAVRPDGELSERCRLHGGLSTGYKTLRGKAALILSNRRRKGEKRKGYTRTKGKVVSPLVAWSDSTAVSYRSRQDDEIG